MRPRITVRGQEPFELEWPPAPLHWKVDDQVHVWSADLDQAAPVARRLKGTLSEDERMRAARFRFDQERERYGVGRGLLRTILAAYLDAEPASLVFEYGPQGKPSLAGEAGTRLVFNLSHSSRLALIAVARAGSVGVDVERVCWLAEAGSIVQRFFSSQEKATFENAPDNKKLRTFFHIWTRKEAALTCDGQGITQIDKPALSFNGFEQELAPAQDYIGNVALSGPARAVRTWRWDVCS